VCLQEEAAWRQRATDAALESLLRALTAMVSDIDGALPLLDCKFCWIAHWSKCIAGGRNNEDHRLSRKCSLSRTTRSRISPSCLQLIASCPDFIQLQIGDHQKNQTNTLQLPWLNATADWRPQEQHAPGSLPAACSLLLPALILFNCRLVPTRKTRLTHSSCPG
jgi:hypothetical protein